MARYSVLIIYGQRWGKPGEGGNVVGPFQSGYHDGLYNAQNERSGQSRSHPGWLAIILKMASVRVSLLKRVISPQSGAGHGFFD